MLWPARRALECERRARAVFRLFRRARNSDTPEVRGLRLLRSWLSPAQLAQYDACCYFDVIGSDTGKRYRIKFGICANITELAEDGAPRTAWCVVPDGCLVPGDIMIAQKIALETCEGMAIARANKLTVPR